MEQQQSDSQVEFADETNFESPQQEQITQLQTNAGDSISRRPHSLSSVVDVDHPNHPQQHEYYMPLSNRLPVKKAMPNVPVTFINSNRSTFSDVMSVSNSSCPVRERKSKFNTSHRVRFPYADSGQFRSMAGGIDEKHMTMLERQQMGEVSVCLIFFLH